MYFQSVIHTPLANSKVILHNGTRYDGVPFIEKSEIAKNIFLKENSININDNLPEQAFESFYYLALGSNHSFDPNLFPYIVDYAKLFHCPDVVFEIERRLLESPNPKMIIQFLHTDSELFPKFFDFVNQNIDVFKNIQEFYDLPTIVLGNLFYENPQPPQLRGYIMKKQALDLILRKKNADKITEELKLKDEAYGRQINELIEQNQYYIWQKNNLLNKKAEYEKFINNTKQKIIGKKKYQIKSVEDQTQKKLKNVDELRNQFVKLIKEIEKKEQNREEKIEFKKKIRRWKR